MNECFVVDASVTLSWCFADEGGPFALQVLEALYEKQAVVPPIWTLEVANVLALAERRGRLSSTATDQFLSLLAKLPIVVDTITADNISPSILMYARSCCLSVYDASYLELAIREGLPLATQDQALLNAMRLTGVAPFQPLSSSDDAVHEPVAAYLVEPQS